MKMQPTALRLADELERDKWHVPAVVMQAAADELRRLHAQPLREAGEQALKAMTKASGWMSDADYRQLNESIEALSAALAEPTGKERLQVEPTVAENATTQRQIEQTPPSEYRRGYWNGFEIGKREGRVEAEDALAGRVQSGSCIACGNRMTGSPESFVVATAEVGVTAPEGYSPQQVEALRLRKGGDKTSPPLRAALAQEPQTTHSEECWRWHHACAVAEVERLRAKVGDAR